MAIDHRHAIRATNLPAVHADPFDRVLVAQAQTESIPIVTTDPAITRYDVETIW
jgi:PIN domain nuclease of toxin-antitoxin system